MAIALFNQLAKQWPSSNPFSRNYVYRLTSHTVNNPPYVGEMVVQQGDSLRENFNTNGWFQFDSTGQPANTVQGDGKALYGETAISDNLFPIRFTAGAPSDGFGKVLGINLPDLDAPGTSSWLTKRLNAMPEFQYPDKNRPHIQRCGNFDFKWLPTWEQYWADQIKAAWIAKFGLSRPNAGTHTDTVYRLVYCHSHHGYAIQWAIPSGTTLTWHDLDTATGEALAHQISTQITDVFEGAHKDIAETINAFDCQTVLGLHLSPTSFSLSNYVYGDLGHTKLTGSAAINNLACGGGPPDCNCGNVPTYDCGSYSSLSVVDEDEPEFFQDPPDDHITGYHHLPSDGSAILDVDGAYLRNDQYRNKWLYTLNINVCNLVKATVDQNKILAGATSDLVKAMNAIATALGTSTMKIDTQPIVDELKAGRDQTKSIFTINPNV